MIRVRSDPSLFFGPRVHDVAAAVLAVLGVMHPRDAAAQSCPAGGNAVHATVTVGDGSTPRAGALVCPTPSIWPQGCGEGWGSVDIPMAYAGTYTFSAGSSGYIGTPQSASITCTNDNGCVTCSGASVSFTLYASEGSITGTVYDATSGAPVSGIPVQRLPYTPPFPWNSDQDGRFEFRASQEPDRSNNWGVTVSSDGSTYGSGYYELIAGGYQPPEDRTPVTTYSSENADVPIYLNSKPPLRCPRCGSGTGPAPKCPPTSAGEPVNVVSGNVWFDQTDASIPAADGVLRFQRSYNSTNAYQGTAGSFGRGWTHSYERSLTFPSTIVIELRETDGTALYFQDRDGDSLFQASLPITETSTIIKNGSTYTRNFPEGGSETYNSTGRLTGIVSASGNATSLIRDGASGRLTSVVVPSGRSLTFDYDGAGRIQSLSGPAGPIASYEYDAAGQLQTVRYPDETGYVFTYDSAGEALTVADLGGTILETHSYSGGKGLTSELSGGMEKLTFAYNGPQTVVTDALGNATTYEARPVHGTRKVTKITGPCSSCGGGAASSQEWTYEASGRVASYKDSAGTVTTYTYDTAGNLISETNPAGTTTYTYDFQGRVLTRSAPATGTVTYVHGPSGPTSITEQVTATLNRTTTAHYTSQGLPDTLTDARGKTTILAYNSFGDLTSVTDPLSHVTAFGHDALGRRTTVTDALSQTTTTAYDARGRVTRLTAPDSTHTDFAYDGGGRRKSVTDPLGRATSYIYDAYGRLEVVVDPLGGVTRYGYDLMSHLTSLTDAKGNLTGFEYDAYGRVKKVTYPGGAYETSTYDTAGRLATRTDRKSVTTTYSYDALSHLTGKTYSDGTTPAVSYTYDAGGRLLTAGNGTDTLTWTYDLAGQLLTEASTKNSSTLAYAYDLGGNRVSVNLDGMLFVTYVYDDASRLTSITRGTSVFGLGYDNANRRTSLSHPNGIITSYTYDTVSRLTNLAATLGAGTITQWGYTYDGAGNRTQKASPDYTEAYGYDALSRLVESNRTGAAGAKRWIYGYDALGNRIREQIDNNVSTPTYNEKNQLLSSTVGGQLRFKGMLDEPGTVTVNGQAAHMLSGNSFEATVSATAGTNTVPVVATDASGNARTINYQVTVAGTTASYSYDPNGSLTQRTEGSDTWTYEWDAENRLKRVLKNAIEVAKFAYDPLGRRVEKVAAGVTTAWAYDRGDILKETTGAVPTLYVHGPDFDEPLAAESGGTWSYIHADGQGSIVAITNAAGTVTSTRRYTPFGSYESTQVTGFSFTGREWDADIRLYYYRWRYYDPNTGRFISEDPIRFRGGVNFYSYVLNNPTTLGDPFGLQAREPKAASGPPAGGTRGFDFCTVNATLVPPFNMHAVIITAPGPGQYNTYSGFNIGAPGCSATCSQIEGGPGNAERASNFVKGFASSGGYFFGAGGTVTVSSSGLKSGDPGVGLGGAGLSGGFSWCWSCKSEEQKRYEQGVVNVFRLIGRQE